MVIFIPIEATSGLNINRLKSDIYQINEVTDMRRLTENLSGKIGELPKVCLGMPLGAKSISKGISYIFSLICNG